jgi:prepilin-type N-terminal cleavage/methylation domain-containing protein
MKKLIKKSFHRKEKGFTLIELLIVIVIIGILAGVLIAVINPVRQQNRSRNATIRASMLKVAFALNATKAGIGRLPNNSELTTDLENLQTNAANCVTTNPDFLDCQFSISGVAMPKYCAENSVAPNATGSGVACWMRMLSSTNSDRTDLISGQFRVIAAAYDLDTVNVSRDIFVFDSHQGMLKCRGNTTYTTSGSALVPFTIITETVYADGTTAGCVILSE